MPRAAAQKAAPFSVRFSKEVDRFLAQEARRLKRPKGAIVEVYTDEMIRMRRFPGIAFRGTDWRRRAWVIGTGLDVWEIVRLLEELRSPEKLAAELALHPEQIRLALAYAAAYPGEIEEMVARSRRPDDDLATRYPFVLEPSASRDAK